MFKHYKKLNTYLNDICVYLEKYHPYLVQYIKELVILNNNIYSIIKDKDYTVDTDDQETDYLTFLEVYEMARNIIGNIDSSYINAYDQILNNGELEFGYNKEFSDSSVIITRTNHGIKRIIDIDRSFDYNEVRTLVHEFIHYTAGHFFNNNRSFLSEFLAIYFEMIAVKKLEDDNKLVDYYFRLKTLRKSGNRFYGYGIVLFAYISFGNINEDTYKDVCRVFKSFNQESFNKHCSYVYKVLKNIENESKYKFTDDYELRCKMAAAKFMAGDYLYIVGVILAIYAHQYCDNNAILYLNSHLSSFDNMNIEEVLNYIGIDIHNEEFMKELEAALNTYINDCNQKVMSLKRI